MPETFRGVHVVRVTDGVRSADNDRAATEEPLEVRLHNRPFAVIMRTPGADRELAAGFLLAEGVLEDADDLGTIEYCTDPSAEHPENIVNARLANRSPDELERLLAERRNVTTNSSCGLCGRLTIESLRCRSAAARVVVDDPGGARCSRFPIVSGRRRRCSTRPAACTRPDCSPATGRSRRSPRMSAATTPWTRSSAGC